jgi:hypothetical protein
MPGRRARDSRVAIRELHAMPVALKVSVLTFARSAGPVYRDDCSRIQALSLIEKLKGG